MGRTLVIVVALLAGTMLMAAVVWTISYDVNVERMDARLTEDIGVAQSAVEAETNRLKSVQSIIMEDPRVTRLAFAATAESVAQANEYLETARNKIGADELFVIAEDGLTIAASNWRESKSFVGQNYAFRPYFKDALKNGKAAHFAVGVTSGIPGYYIAQRVDVPENGRVVLVIKLDLRPLELAWQRVGASIAIADNFGVIFVSGVPEWDYRPLAPLTAAQLEDIATGKIYSGIDMTIKQPLFKSAGDLSGLSLDVGGRQFMFKAARPGNADWIVISGRPAAQVRDSADNHAAIVGLFGLIIAGLFLLSRQHRQMLRLKAEQNEALENRVVERTAELGNEIEERKRTEAHLRETQQELVQTAKLAALGQISAAIAHEVSQPLTALETTLAAGLAHAQNGALDKASERISRARSLTQRMQRIIRHLRSFARKDAGEPELVSLINAIKGAIELAEPRGRELGAEVKFDDTVPDCLLFMSAVRLEQVILNLLLNGLDAVEGRGVRSVSIDFEQQTSEVLLHVCDTGTGISPEIERRLTEPFFSTKSGGSLGLGLSISATIIQDFGGNLDFRPNPGGGTVCEVKLPIRDGALTEAAQ